MLTPSHHTFHLPNLDPAHDGLRIAHLTDLHLGRATPQKRIARAIALANAFEPDLVALTGDYLCHHERGLELMRERLRGLAAPVFCVLGNHDHWVSSLKARRALEALGYAVLQNESHTLTLRGAPFTVVGIDDLVTRHHDVQHAFRGLSEAGSRLVLAHVPRTVELLRHQPAALLLAGHTHGGHVNLPLVTKLLMGRANERYLSGAFQVGDWQLYVNRGLGGAVFPLRINAPPEVALLTLRAAGIGGEGASSDAA